MNRLITSKRLHSVESLGDGDQSELWSPYRLRQRSLQFLFFFFQTQYRLHPHTSIFQFTPDTFDREFGLVGSMLYPAVDTVRQQAAAGLWMMVWRQL